jgi:hypothetical protein
MSASIDHSIHCPNRVVVLDPRAVRRIAPRGIRGVVRKMAHQHERDQWIAT